MVEVFLFGTGVFFVLLSLFPLDMMITELRSSFREKFWVGVSAMVMLLSLMGAAAIFVLGVAVHVGAIQG